MSKKIIIASNDLGIITPYKDGDHLWSSSILSEPYAECLMPVDAIYLLRNAIPETQTKNAFIVPVQTTETQLHMDDPALTGIRKLWEIKHVNAIVTGQDKGKPLVSTIAWRGTISEVEAGHHLNDFAGWIKEKGITHATVYTDSEKHLLAGALKSLDKNPTTIHDQLYANYTERINELVESINTGDHPIKTHGKILEIQETLAAQQQLVRGNAS